MIGKNETIVTAWAEYASGPGWSNRPIWVIVRDNGSKNLREECIQPDDQTPEMMWLYDISNTANLSMKNAVHAWSFSKRKRKK